MSLKFKCENCDKEIVSNFLKVGDKLKCPRCNNEVKVPESSIEVEEDSNLLTHTDNNESSYEPIYEKQENIKKDIIAKRSTRVKAFLIDFIVLAGITNIINLLFKDILFSIWNYTPLIGFLISFTYFGIVPAFFLKGQTIGQKKMKIIPVDEQKNLINKNKILIRAGFFSFFLAKYPIFLNTESWNMIYTMILGFISFNISFNYIYFWIFNGKTGQSLIDIFTSTFTINQNAHFDHDIPKVSFLHKGVSFLFFIVMILIYITMYWGSQKIFQHPLFASIPREKLQKICTELRKDPRCIDVGYRSTNNSFIHIFGNLKSGNKQKRKGTYNMLSFIIVADNKIKNVYEIEQKLKKLIKENLTESEIKRYNFFFGSYIESISLGYWTTRDIEIRRFKIESEE